jgi:signal transduction histidine kinase
VAGALRDLAERMTSGTTLRTGVTVSGTPRPLPATVEHHLFRIGVEALTNAVRHSGASRVDIELRFAGDGTDLIVRDDGSGFAPAEVAQGEHFGLRGIRERVDKLGGTLALDCRHGQGTRLAVRVPAPDAAAAEHR